MVKTGDRYLVIFTLPRFLSSLELDRIIDFRIPKAIIEKAYTKGGSLIIQILITSNSPALPLALIVVAIIGAMGALILIVGMPRLEKVIKLPVMWLGAGALLIHTLKK